MAVGEGPWEFVGSWTTVSGHYVWEKNQYTVWYSGLWGRWPSVSDRLCRSTTTSSLGRSELHWRSCLHRWHCAQSRYSRLKRLLMLLPWQRGRYLPYGITQCYLLPDTSERAPLNPSLQAGIQFTRRDGRLSWPGGWLHNTEMVYLPADSHPSKY